MISKKYSLGIWKKCFINLMSFCMFFSKFNKFSFMIAKFIRIYCTRFVRISCKPEKEMLRYESYFTIKLPGLRWRQQYVLAWLLCRIVVLKTHKLHRENTIS